MIVSVRTVGSNLEKDVSVSNFQGRAFEFFDRLETNVAFVVGKADNVNIVHKKTSV